MANIYDYLAWRGDIRFSERPFNDVDNIILATLSYLDFTGIVPGERAGGSIALADACLQLVRRAGGQVEPFVRSLAKLDTRLVELLAHSRRFGEAQLHSYADIVDPAKSLEFSAVQIDLPTGETYVSFRGTDSTLIGWREDFMMSFTVTEDQHEAVRYLTRAVERAVERGRAVLVGGHSKGGNLALYAAECCSDDVRAHITRVYDNDGPGMAPEVMPSRGHELLGQRLKRFVPTYSVVGMLFARPEDRRIIVKSSGVGIGQHDPTTWQVLPTGVDEAMSLLPECMIVNHAIASWAEGIPLKERRRVVREVFDALGAGGAIHFDEIGATGEGLQQVLKALSNTDERTRSIVMTLLGSTISLSLGAAREAAQETVDTWRRGAREIASEAAQQIFGTSNKHEKQ